MKNRNTVFGVNKSIINAFHKVMLIAILHSSLIAPSQNLIISYLNYHEPLHYKGYLLNKYNSAGIPTVKNQNEDLQLVKGNQDSVIIGKNSIAADVNLNQHYTISSDLVSGYIGVSNERPLDDSNDNLFKVYLKELPNSSSKVYLTYELYGAQDYTAVSRSINNRFSTGGHIVKNQMGWTSQKEEINASWLKTGENKIMFGIPNGAAYQYQIKNLKIEIDGTNNSNTTANLVVPNLTINYFKNNQIYIKGFLRNITSKDVKVYFDENLVTCNDAEFEGFLTLTDAVKKRKFIIVKAFDSKGILGQEIITLDNLIESDKIFPIEETTDNVSNVFKAYKANYLRADGASVILNDSALVVDKEITIKKLRTIDIAPMASGMINVTKGGFGYRFLPDGTKFEKPVKLSIAYDEKLIPKGYTTNDIKTFYFNTDSKSWVAVKRDTINIEEKTIHSRTTHFTDYINGIIQTPESPETAGFTPTMMNDIKAADPSSEMTIISPPEVSQKGSANVSYPIKIPAGRKGMQPQLAVQYTNESGNGWLGQGWNITVPSLTIDTRWGVPLMDPDHETEIYSLNGEQLMYPKIENKDGNKVDWMPNRHYDESTTSTIYSTIDRERITNAVFTPRKQGSFALIERLGDNLTNYYWKVTATDGTVSWYGGKNGVVENTVLRDEKKNIVHWGLYMTEDVFSNNVIYEYENYVINGQSGLNANLNNGHVFNVSNIYYTGYKDEKGLYEIDFITAARGINRPDITINARLGIKQIDPYLLKNLIVLNNSNEENIKIRTYAFGYRPNLNKFKKSQLEYIAEQDKDDKEFYRHTFEYYDDIADDRGNDIYFSSGIDVSICNDTYEPCKDSDGDKICDDVDGCPNVPGPVSNNGCPLCPDKDKDGVCDEIDHCPDVPGPASNNGCPLCPDKDNDGVCDNIDRCPDVPGPASNNGCPIVTNQCFKTGFFIPQSQVIKYNYGYDTILAVTNTSQCLFAPIRIQSIINNGSPFDVTNRKILFTHGDANSENVNRCPFVSYPLVSLPNVDYGVQNPFAATKLNNLFVDYFNLNSIPSYNLTTSILGYTYSSGNSSFTRGGCTVDFYSQDNTMNLNLVIQGRSLPNQDITPLNWQTTSSMPFSETPVIIPINSQVFLNNSTFLLGTYDFDEPNQVIQFQTDLNAMYSNTIVTMLSSGFLSISTSNPLLSNITVVPIGSNITHTYNFVNCMFMKTEANLTLKDDWKGLKASEKQLEYGIKRFQANGHELELPIKDLALICSVDLTDNSLKDTYLIKLEKSKETYMDSKQNAITSSEIINKLKSAYFNDFKLHYQKLNEDFQEKEIERRKINQEKAIVWLETYYKNQKADNEKKAGPNKKQENITKPEIAIENNKNSVTTNEKLTKKDYSKFFKEMSDNYTYTFSGTIPIDTNPNCPSFLNYDMLFQDYIPSFDSTLGVLGTSITKADNIGFYIGVGIGCRWYTKSTTFGAQWSWSKDSSKARTSLVDINGDGLQDIVLMEYDGFLYYKEHKVIRTYDENNQPVITHSFGPKKPISGINNFYNAYGSSKSRNFQITFGVSHVGGFVGKDKSKSKATNNVYFADGNGDGLTDIVKNGVVYFNRLDFNKNPLFNSESENTENMVIVAEPASVNEPADEPDDFTIPNFDVVKVWEAPADGTITIDNTIVNTDSSKQAMITVEMEKETTTNTPKVATGMVNPQSVNLSDNKETPKSDPKILNQESYAKAESERNAKVALVEKDIKSYIENAIDKFTLTKQQLYEIANPPTEDAKPITITGSVLDAAIIKTKYDELRKLYFQENASQLEFYNRTAPPNAQACDNGGFESGITNDYEFDIKNLPTTIVHVECDFDTTSTTGGFYDYIPTNPFQINNDYVNVESLGPPTSPYPNIEPLLANVGVIVPRVKTGHYSMRLNDTVAGDAAISGGPGDLNFATKMTKSFFLDYVNPATNPQDNSLITFSFNFICQNPQHETYQQPRFIARLYDKNNNIIDEFCLVSDVNNTLMFHNATANFPSSTPLLYTNWQCASLSTGGIQNLQNQADREVRLEFSVNDCTLSAHYGYVYIDDICTNAVNSCNNPAYGQLNLDFNNPQLTNCPTFPITVTGTYTAPHSLNTPIVYPANTPTLQLDVLKNGVVVGTRTLPVTALTNPTQQHTFSFQLQQSDFGILPLNGNFEFRVTAVFTINGVEFSKTVTSAISGPDVSFNNCNPVTLSCDSPKDICLLYGANLNAGQTIVHPINTNCTGGTLNVKKGSRIYFRLHSISGGNPRVDWNPKVTYTAGVSASALDQNGLKLYDSKYNDGFILSGFKPAPFPGNVGTATITWNPITVNNPSDQVTFEVFHRNTVAQNNSDDDVLTGDSLPLYTFVCPANANSIVAPSVALSNIPISITGSDSNLTLDDFYFRVTSSSNVNWKQIEWKPIMQCAVQTQVIGESGSLEGTLTSNETVYPIVDYSIYKSYGCSPGYSMFNTALVNGGVGLSIKPNLNGIFTTGDNGVLNFVIKANGLLVGKRIITITNSSVTYNDSTPILLGTASGQNIEIGYYANDYRLFDDTPSLLYKIAISNNSTVRIYYNSTSSFSDVPNSSVNLFQRPNPKFGPMLRQWGQFMYNPSAVTGAVNIPPYGNLIKRSTLFYNLALANNINTAISSLNQNSIDENNIDTIDSNYNNLFNLPLLIASPLKDKDKNGLLFERWVGLHDENYASEFSSRAATMEQYFDSSFDGEAYDYQNILQTGAYGINKLSTGKNKNFSGGASVGGGSISVGANASKTLTGDNKASTDYIDFNGDRYPDIVTSEQVQFTKRVGGLFKPTGRSGDINISQNSTWGFGAQGSYTKGGDDGGSPKGYPKLHVSFEGFKGNAGGGLSVSFSQGQTASSRVWTDINGDGLADLLEKDSSGQVSIGLNYGYAIEGNYLWNLDKLFDSKSTNISGGGGINKWNGSLEAGVGITSAWSDSKNSLIDMNGDGLLDYVSSGDDINVRVNEGNRFINFDQVWSNENMKRESVSVGFNANITATFAFCWYIPFTTICLKIPALSGSKSVWSTTTNKTKKTITDFDGDGYPDIVEQISGTSVRVYSSRIRRTDMLKSVTNPLGGKFTIDYKVQPVTYDDSQAKWTMSDLIVEDGYDKVNDGRDIYKKHFIYEEGRYDRREREFYGYATVKVQDYAMDDENVPTAIYRTSVSKYHNRSYFLNGSLTESYMIKGEDDNAKFSKTVNIYEVRKLADDDNNKMTDTVLPNSFDVGGKEGRRSAVVVLTKTFNYLYELSTTPQLTTEADMMYDDKGRVVLYKNLGDISNGADNFESKIKYHDLTNNIINVPALIEVNDGSLKRRRTTEVEPSTGSIEAIHALIDNPSTNTEAITHMKYDQYGNLVQITYPQNSGGQSMYYDYKYDSIFNKYVVGIGDAFNYASSATYDSNFDKILETKDLAGNLMKYEYDSFGRNTLILAPKEIEAGIKYTIKFAYFPLYRNLGGTDYESCVDKSLFTPFAVTNHYDPQHRDNDIQTISFVDGLARPIQVKKDIQLNVRSPREPDYREAMSISGKVWFDDFGRAIKQFHPYFEDKDCKWNYIVNEYEDTLHPSETQLDELDRPVRTTDQEGNESTMEYSLANDVDGTMSIKTMTKIDQNGSQNIITETYKDVFGKVISTNNVGGSTGAIWTRFRYNAIGELGSYTDDQGITTKYEYDLLGRKTAVHHPDNGTTSFEYDNASNLTQLQTANLANDGSLDPANRFVKYYYNFNRLQNIVYPNNPDGSNNISNVSYGYGNAGNQTSRLVYQQDATGTQEFEYGNMGEMTHSKRIVVGPNIPTLTYDTYFGYDSWNRLQIMEYPDGEKVNYNYDLGGNLFRMTGEVNSGPYNYIERIDYDYYEQRAYLLYGNKTETFYDYTPSLRRLGILNVKTSSGQDLFYNKYGYDKVGNIIGLDNSAGYTSNGMGGNYNHEFKYDNLNRLIEAYGKFSGDQASQQPLGNDYSSDYSLSMKYDNTHGIEQKAQKHYKNGSIFSPNTYENGYKYYSGSHKVESVTDNYTGNYEYFKYDQNGNITSRNDNHGSNRQMLWDESNRLRVVNDPMAMQHYIYDAGGSRILKANTDAEAVYQNGTLVTNAITINGYTTYPSAFIVTNQLGIYSKHYYAGDQRIVSRIGERNATEIFTSREGKTGNANTSFDEKKLQKAQLSEVKALSEKVGRKNVFFKEFKPYTYEGIETIIKEAADSITVQRPDPWGPGIKTAPLYFYHPDHLGTSTALTDFNGNAYQIFLNLPFGETMAEQLPTSYYKSPYKFNGKELDEETGYYYYSARYYDPRISIWMSTDPKAEKMPSWNPYNYTMQNPVNLKDPTGMEPEGCDPPKKNIYVVIDYEGSFDPSRDTISFEGMNKENWQGIYAKDIQDANQQVSGYLQGTQADNMVLETHGSFTRSKETGQTTGTCIYGDNNNGKTISTKNLRESLAGNNNTNQADVDALVGLINQVAQGGNFFSSTCHTAQDDNFFNNLSDLTGNKVNLFGSPSLCGPGEYTPNGTGNAIYNPTLLFNHNLSKGPVKMYQADCKGDPPIIIQGIIMDRRGLKPIN